MKIFTFLRTFTLLCAMLLLTSSGWGQEVLNAWNTNGLSGITEDGWNATTTAANMQTGALSRGSGLTPTSLANGFAASGWNETSLENAKTDEDYFQFFISPASGYKLSLSSVQFNTRRTSTGPTNLQLTYSTDGSTFIEIGSAITGYDNTTDGFAHPAINISDVSALQNFTGTTTFRLYGWDASAGTGTLSFGRTGAGTNDLTVIGTIELVGGATLPSISNIIQTPAADITSTTTVSVSANVIAGDAAIDHVELRWGTSTGTYPNVISMALGTGDTYTTISDIPAQADGTTVYYVVYAEDVDSESATSTEQTYTVRDPAFTTLPYEENFNTDLGDCYVYTKAGSKPWDHESSSAIANGFNGENPEEHWLVLPGINLNNYDDEVMTFTSYARYGTIDENNYLKLFYSTDYLGIGDPATSTWTELSFDKPASGVVGTTEISTPSGNIDLSIISGNSVYLAFKYYSTDSPTQWRIDDILIQEVPVEDPLSFAAQAASSSQIDLTFTTNATSNDVVIVHNADGNFSDPSGTPPAAGSSFAGGTLLYNGAISPQSHSGLSPDQTVYYKAFSYDGTNYSPGLTANATTHASEPTAHVTDFIATANTHSTITVSWTDSDADFYLIKGSDVDVASIAAPVDGTPEADGGLVKNVAAEVGTHTFTELAAGAEYFFKIFPYNGTGSTVNYKTDGIVPETNATTEQVISDIPFSTKFDVADKWNLITAAGTYGEKKYEEGGWYFHSTFAVRASDAKEVYEGSNYSFRDRDVFTAYNIGSIAQMTGFSLQLRHWMNTPARDRDLNISFDGGETWETLVAINPDWFTEEFDGEFQPFIYFFEEAKSFGPGEFKIQIINGGNVNNGRINIGQFTAYNVLPSLTTWTGSVSNDWSETGNWTDGVPSETKNVVVPGGLTNYPSINASSKVLDLTIEQGATLLDNGNLTIFGVFTMEREIPFGGWQMIGSPVSGMDIIGSDFAPTATPLPSNFDFYYFDESVSDNPWINLRGADGVPNTTDFTQFVPGRGYLVAYFDGSFATNPFSFTGSLNTGNFDMPLNYTAGANEGWNLVGNPYPSGIDWGSLNKTALTENAAQIYNRVTEEYVPQEGGIIAANQGFFVKTGSTGALSLTNADRVHGGSYAKENDQQERLVLSLANDAHNSSTTVRLIDGTSYEHDRRDASKLFSLADHMPQIYTHTSDQVKVAINSIPAIDEEKVIKVGARIPADGSYTLSASEISGRFQSSPLYLLNIKSGEIHNLKENPQYSFQAVKGDVPALFELWFTQPTDVPQMPAEGLTRIYTYGQTLYLEFAQEAPGRIMEVFDISGRKLIHRSLGNGMQLTEQLNLQTGVYIVRVSSTQDTETKRIFVE
jgi:hypothetical protein